MVLFTGSRRLITAGIAVGLLLSTGCGDGDGAAAGDLEFAVEALRSRSEGVDGVRLYESVAELLPNVTFVADDEALPAAAERVVVGTVKEVEPGDGYVLPAGDAPQGTAVDFEDVRAEWRSIRLALQVEEVLAGPEAPGAVTFGLVINGSVDADRAMDGLGALGRIVAFLGPAGSPLFAPADDLHPVVGQGTALAIVGDDGQLRLPFVDPVEGAELLRGSASLEDLRRHADAPPATVTVTRGGDGASYLRPSTSPCQRCTAPTNRQRG